MTFNDALEAMKTGKKVWRREWKFVKWITLNRPTDKVFRDSDDNPFEKICADSILATDWEVVDNLPALKPCPFCGGEADIVRASTVIKWWSVNCRECGISSQHLLSKAEAIAAWNRRAEQKPRTNFEKWMATITPGKTGDVFEGELYVRRMR